MDIERQGSSEDVLEPPTLLDRIREKADALYKLRDQIAVNTIRRRNYSVYFMRDLYTGAVKLGTVTDKLDGPCSQFCMKKGEENTNIWVRSKHHQKNVERISEGLHVESISCYEYLGSVSYFKEDKDNDTLSKIAESDYCYRMLLSSFAYNLEIGSYEALEEIMIKRLDGCVWIKEVLIDSLHADLLNLRDIYTLVPPRHPFVDYTGVEVKPLIKPKAFSPPFVEFFVGGGPDLLEASRNFMEMNGQLLPLINENIDGDALDYEDFVEDENMLPD